MFKLRERAGITLPLAILVFLAVGVGLFGQAAFGWGAIGSVSPSHARVGQNITIQSSGGGASFENAKGKVWIGGVEATDVGWSSSAITAKVPFGAVNSGVRVELADGWLCETANFYVDPYIDFMFPPNVSPGQTATLEGGGFPYGVKSSKVIVSTSKGTREAKITSFDSYRIQFTVPDLAPGKYCVSVDGYVYPGTEKHVVSNTILFDVVGPPQIESVSPPSPCSGGIIELIGRGFGEVRALLDKIMFRNVTTGEYVETTSYPSWSETKIRARFPKWEPAQYEIVFQHASDSDVGYAGTSDNGLAPPGDIVNPTSRAWAHDSIGVPEPARNWYIAEGSTAGGDEMWVLVQNPGDRAAGVKVTYVTSSQKKTVPVSVPANSRTSLRASDAFPDTDGVSAKVTSDADIVAEKAVYGNHRSWGNNSVGISEPAEVWYLAEGCTAAGYQTRISVMNPNTTSATVKLTYMTSSGPVKGPSETIPANSRRSYNVGDRVKDAWEVSTKVESDRPVAAERAMFGNGGAWSHDSIGVSGLRKTWYLAEGCTAPGFETWVLVQNPNDKPARVNLTYMTSSGAVQGPSEIIGARSRKTFEVAKTVPGVWEVSTKVESDQPIVAERAMYGLNRTWAHDSVGVSEPGRTCYLAEGCTLRDSETWILVQNPNPTPAAITITYMTPSGAQRGPSEYVPANSRKTYNVADTVNLCPEVSTKVVSDSNIVVERAMYGDIKY